MAFEDVVVCRGLEFEDCFGLVMEDGNKKKRLDCE
jgi:hypothetical protein